MGGIILTDGGGDLVLLVAPVMIPITLYRDQKIPLLGPYPATLSIDHHHPLTVSNPLSGGRSSQR